MIQKYFNFLKLSIGKCAHFSDIILGAIQGFFKCLGQKKMQIAPQRPWVASLINHDGFRLKKKLVGFGIL